MPFFYRCPVCGREMRKRRGALVCECGKEIQLPPRPSGRTGSVIVREPNVKGDDVA